MRFSRTSEFAFGLPGFPSSKSRGPPELPSSSLELHGTLSNPLVGPPWNSATRSPTPESVD
eukprot:11096600-Alexandrium_andersonii.AAC.1